MTSNNIRIPGADCRHRRTGRDNSAVFSTYNNFLGRGSTFCPSLPATAPLIIADNPSNPLLDLRRSDEASRELFPFMRSTIPPRFFDGYGMRNFEFIGQRHVLSPSFPPDEQRSRSKPIEQSTPALRKTVYNPMTKKMTRRLSLYYKDKSGTETEKEDEDGRRCAVCLEDFNPKEMVMRTPCDHMFHEDCILPWLKSNKQCPICRFALISNHTECATPSTAENNGMDDLSWFFLAIEDAFGRRNHYSPG